MIRIVVLIVLSLAAIGVALLLQRRRPEAPSAPSYRAPRQIDRNDFDVPAELRMIVVFTSATCQSCSGVWDTVTSIERARTGAQRVEIQTTPDLHRRYRIDGVPTTLVVDPEGVVTHTFFGPFPAADLEAALDERG